MTCPAMCSMVAPGLGSAGSVLDRLPARCWAVRYAGARFPGSAAVLAEPGLEAGGNCQVFAYAILRFFGLDPPELRSSELWADTLATMRVSRPRPLDLLLFNATSRAWGAHVGVWAGDDQVLHLCAEVGRPAVWPMGRFETRARYRTLVGIKRVLRHL